MKPPSKLERLVLGCIDSYNSDQRLLFSVVSTPVISESRRLFKILTKNLTKYTKLKVNFAYVSFKNINCAQNVNSSHLEVC